MKHVEKLGNQKIYIYNFTKRYDKFNKLMAWCVIYLVICDTGAQNPSFVVFVFFLLNHILHCICFKIQNILFLTEVMLV